MIYVIETITTLKLSYTAKFTCFVKLLLVIIIRGCAHCVQESSISIIIDLIKSRDTMPCNTTKLACKASLSRNDILISPIRIIERSLTCTIKNIRLSKKNQTSPEQNVIFEFFKRHAFCNKLRTTRGDEHKHNDPRDAQGELLGETTIQRSNKMSLAIVQVLRPPLFRH